MILFFILGKINSQSDFRNGYIIRLNKDTVYGLIDYKGNSANAKKCLFKKDANSEISEFTPGELNAYRFIDSKYYVSKSLQSGDKAGQLFLEYLIDGIVDIYYYRDELGEHYLADKGDGKLYALKNEEKVVSVTSVINNNEYITKYTGDSKEYIGILRYVFDKSPRIGRKVENISLDHKSLINIADEYHKEVCQNEQCIIFEKNLPKFKTTFGPVVGLNVTTISTNDKYKGTLSYFNKSDFDISVCPSIGFYVKINLPYINERLYFQYQSIISKIRTNTMNSFMDGVLSREIVHDITLTESISGNSALLKYEFPGGAFRPSFHAGFFLNYFFKTDYLDKTDSYTFHGDPISSTETKENPFAKLDYGLCVGIGVIRKINTRNLYMDITYQHGVGFLVYLTTNNFLVNFGFQLGK
jgi:hypothetical protein